jgi:hypothetical protein
MRTIAGQFAVSKTAIGRHQIHVATDLAEAVGVCTKARTQSLLDEVQAASDRVEDLYRLAQSILNNAVGRGDKQTALNAVRSIAHVLRECRNFMELRGRISGELHQTSAANQVVIVMPAPPIHPHTEEGEIVDIAVLPRLL